MDHETRQMLEQAQKATLPAEVRDRVFLGFDGFIDQLLSVVRMRRSPDDFEVMPSMKAWAARIASTAGSSTSIERVTKRAVVGGFTSNVGKALATLCGRVHNVHLLGLFGKPTIRDIFLDQLADRCTCELFSIGNPGETDAYEFADGKVMMVNFENVLHQSWTQILSFGGPEFLQQELDASKLWGVGYWNEGPHMAEVYRKLQEEILPNLAVPTRQKFLLLDLADLRLSSRESLQLLAKLLPRFEQYVQVVLILNDKELDLLSSSLGSPKADSPVQLTRSLAEKLGLSYVIAHHPRWACLASPEAECTLPNAYTSSPRFTTSAGDHFDAGVGYGLLAGVPPEGLLVLGNCATSYFVRTGVSPSLGDVQQFIRQYARYLETHSETILPPH